VMSALTNL